MSNPIVDRTGWLPLWQAHRDSLPVEDRTAAYDALGNLILSDAALDDAEGVRACRRELELLGDSPGRRAGLISRILADLYARKPQTARELMVRAVEQARAGRAA